MIAESSMRTTTMAVASPSSGSTIEKPLARAVSTVVVCAVSNGVLSRSAWTGRITIFCVIVLCSHGIVERLTDVFAVEVCCGEAQVDVCVSGEACDWVCVEFTRNFCWHSGDQRVRRDLHALRHQRVGGRQ